MMLFNNSIDKTHSGMISRLVAGVVVAMALTGCSNMRQADKTVVLKDTRNYVMTDGKRVLRDGRPIVKDGEYLTRSGDQCEYHSYRFELTAYELDDGVSHISVPKEVDGVILYRCAEDGSKLPKDAPRS